jgi:hypothetical protein
MVYNFFLTIRLGWIIISPKIMVFLRSHKFLAANANVFLTIRLAIEVEGGMRVMVPLPHVYWPKT